MHGKKLFLLLFAIAIAMVFITVAACDDDDDDDVADDDVGDDDTADDDTTDDDIADDDTADDDVGDDDTVEPTWNVETVIAGYTDTRYHSLAFLSDGTPVIAYYQRIEKNLAVAMPGAKGWTISTIDSGVDVGQYCSIAVDGNDRIGIAYFDAEGKDLKLAFKDLDGDWNTQVLDDNRVGEYSQIHFDKNNWAHVYALRAGSAWYINYYREADAWYMRELFRQDLDYGFAMDFDSTDRAGFTWYEWEEIEPYKLDGWDKIYVGFWDLIQLEKVYLLYQGEGIRKNFYAFTFDGEDKPMAFFTTSSFISILVCTVSGTQWVIYTLPEEEAIIDGPIHAAHGGDGRVWLTYTNILERKPRVAGWDGVNWTFHDVVDVGLGGAFIKVGVAPDNQPAIIYYDADTQSLMYAKYE